jgi:hypothetical protein
MKAKILVVLFAVMLAGTAFAGDSGNGCKLQGTWLWNMPTPISDNLRFWATYNGTGDNDGTEIVEYINYSQNIASYSTARGVWKKSGPNKYDYTMIDFLFLRDTGDILAVTRYTGTKTMIDCNTIEATAWTEVLDPETMEPITPPTGGGIATGHRILLQKPPE